MIVADNGRLHHSDSKDWSGMKRKNTGDQRDLGCWHDLTTHLLWSPRQAWSSTWFQPLSPFLCIKAMVGHCIPLYKVICVNAYRVKSPPEVDANLVCIWNSIQPMAGQLKILWLREVPKLTHEDLSLLKQVSPAVPKRLGEDHRREDRTNGWKIWGRWKVLWNAAFWTWPGHSSHEDSAPIVTYTRPVQDQASEISPYCNRQHWLDSEFKKQKQVEDMTWGGGCVGGSREGWGAYDQDTLFSSMKLSKNK